MSYLSGLRMSKPVIALVLLAMVAIGCSDSSGETTDPEPHALPTLEQLRDSGNCDELNGLLAEVEDEMFRVNNDRTLDEEQARVEDAYDTTFDIYYETFSETQSDLGCSDAEMMAALQTASDQRCQAWINLGHSLDENPLLLNTASCTDAED